MNTVSTKADAPRGGFPEACVGWPCSGLTATPPAGGPSLRPVPERLSIPLSPRPDHTPGGGDGVFGPQGPTPLHPLPPLTRSQASRALRATGQEECGTGLDLVGQNGAGKGGSVERVGEFYLSHRITRLLPDEVGEVARRRSRRDGGGLVGVSAVKNPSTTSWSPSPSPMGRRPVSAYRSSTRRVPGGMGSGPPDQSTARPSMRAERTGLPSGQARTKPPGGVAVVSRSST